MNGVNNMDIKFEGDIAALAEKPEELCRKILQEKGFTNCVVQVETVGKKGDNYVANVKRFIAQQDGVNDGKPFRLIAKLAPFIDQVREMIGTAVAFANEIIVYSELFPKYDQIQEEANIPEEDRFKHPICYGFLNEAPNEAIFLEDLRERDFILLDRLVSMTKEQARIALRDLAKFHALSFVIKVKEPQLYEQMKNKLINIWVQMMNTSPMEQFMNAAEQQTQDLLKSEDDKMRTKGHVKNIVKKSIMLNNIYFNAKHSVLIQGDCWTNNMMFKLEEDRPLEVIMLDYQITRVAAPAVDVLYFLLNCVDYDLRKQYFFELLDDYYKSLEDFLSHFNLKANYLYPRDKFDADLKMNGKTSFGTAVMLSNILVREAEDVIDFKENPELLTDTSIDAFNVNDMREVVVERYNKKVDGLIKSCIEYGYL